MSRALFFVVFALWLTSQAAESRQIWSPFTPNKNIYARRLVSERFQLVHAPQQIEPQVRTAFHEIVPRRVLAVGSQAFAITDVSAGLPRRFDFAGHSGDLWFVLYEVGGRAYHHSLIIFQRRGRGWRQVDAAAGFPEHTTHPSLIRAIKSGRFHRVSDRLNL